ncbi:hypothetical protein [Micromonospora sp. LOL_021]|uniref:PIN-like domain-containing protein n=1 Tax=Micromonospora sp. LOL_021 TaxID=3345417 RepID=UPI003A83E7EC
MPTSSALRASSPISAPTSLIPATLARSSTNANALRVPLPRPRDSEWIPEVAGRGWLIITRDRHIQEHRLEIAAVREHRAKMVALTAADAGSVFGQLEVVMSRWRDIERCLAEPRPFIYAATRTTMRQIPLT